MKVRLVSIIVAFVLSFAIMIALSLLSFKRFDSLTRSMENLELSYKTLGVIDELEQHFKDVDRAERGYLLTRDTIYPPLLRRASDTIMPISHELLGLTASYPSQHRKVIMLRSFLLQRLQKADSSMLFADTGAAMPRPDSFFYSGRAAMRRSAEYFNQLRLTQRETLAKNHMYKNHYLEMAAYNLRYLFVAFLFLTMVLFGIMVLEIRKRIHYQGELQLRVLELRRSHRELEQIAFATSHHLREPLRKIQVFADRYARLSGGAEASDLHQRIVKSAQSAQDLIEDLGALTGMVNEGDQWSQVPLSDVWAQVRAGLAEELEAKAVRIVDGPLPVLYGQETQLRLLLHALLENAIKFSRPGSHPYVVVSWEEVSGRELMNRPGGDLAEQYYHRVTITDNGIGFDNRFARKLFELFQKLHASGSGYDGKGLGLALCKRIMANHQGYIRASGVQSAGASFRLYFPK